MPLANRILTLIEAAKGTGSKLTLEGLIRGAHAYGQFKKTYFKDWHPTVPPSTAGASLIKINPAIGVKTLTFSGIMKSMTNPGQGYNMLIVFQGVNFSEEPQPDWIDVQAIMDNGEKKVYYCPPANLDTKVAVRCTCPDFAFRFWYPLKKYNAIALPQRPAQIGKWLKQVQSGKIKRKGKPQNPHNIPGICKHLMSFFIVLRDQGFIKVAKLW